MCRIQSRGFCEIEKGKATVAGNRGCYAPGVWHTAGDGGRGWKSHEGLSLVFKVIHLPLQEAAEWLYLDRDRSRDATGITGIPGNCLSDTGAAGGEVGKGRSSGGGGGGESVQRKKEGR